ncbi:MAG: WbqC family protein [Chitinophagaceae bacterium]|nr:WbqC family protein [Chitinophagaceae bacterium]
MLIIDLQYFGNINYYNYLLNSSHIIFDQYENYRKMSFHNRCAISGANGVIVLSVPVEGGRTQRTPFCEVRISRAEKWQRAHWRGIVSSYNRSPWFEYYHDELAVLFQTEFLLLSDWNKACLEWSFKQLRVPARFEYSREYRKEYEGEGIKDWRGKITPRDPAFGLATVAAPKMVYRQVFEERGGFRPHLSILDLLFCEGGKKAAEILKWQ